MLEIGLIVFFPFLMMYAAFSDFFSMTISNKVALALIAGFLVFALWSGMPLAVIGWHFAIFALVLGVSFGLFAAGAIGGGDAKLAASTALWLGWEYTLVYLIYASLIGALLTLIIMRLRSHVMPYQMAGVEWAARLYRADNGIPYGIALGAAALLVYPQTPWMQYVFRMAGEL